MSEKKSIEVIVGEKGRQDGEGGADSNAPVQQEVGGRYLVDKIVECPHCGSLRQIVASTRVYKWYTCGNCGHDYYY